MYNLDAILDEVRAKYYASNVLPRPTISWSDEWWTEFYGKYTILDKYSELEKISIAKTGFNELWASNALCKMDINFRSLYLNANSLRQSGMIDLAYEVMKQSYGLSNGEDYVVEEMIITCALINDFKLGNQIIKELSMINNENPHIDKCIQFLTKGN